jgi:hypothetical protein
LYVAILENQRHLKATQQPNLPAKSAFIISRTAKKPWLMINDRCNLPFYRSPLEFSECCLPSAYLRPLNTIQLEAALERKAIAIMNASLSEANGGTYSQLSTSK